MVRFPSNLRHSFVFPLFPRLPPPHTATALTSLHDIRPPSLLTPSICVDPPLHSSYRCAVDRCSRLRGPTQQILPQESRQAQSSKAPLDQPYCGSSAHHPVTHMRLPPFPAPTPARALRPAHSITALPHHSRWCDSTAFAVTQSIQQGCHSCTCWARVWSVMYGRAVLGRTDNRTSYASPCCCATSPIQPCTHSRAIYTPAWADLHAVVHILRGADFLRLGAICTPSFIFYGGRIFSRRHPVVWQFYVIYCTPDSTPFHAFLRPNQNPDGISRC